MFNIHYQTYLGYGSLYVSQISIEKLNFEMTANRCDKRNVKKKKTEQWEVQTFRVDK